MSKKYSVIYADPPWDLKAGCRFSAMDRSSQPLSYPTLSVQEIMSIPVSDLAHQDAHLYLWTTNKYLPHAFEVIKEWGFSYSTTVVWAKNTFGGGGLGGTFKLTTEFLLFARRGNLKAKLAHPTSWFNVKRQYENGVPKHSKKPYFFHDLIEATSPGEKIELFDREKRGSWDVWGNQVKSDIKLEV